jgi:hypothetical protein
MSMSASGGKADIPDTPHRCPLMTQSGHQLGAGLGVVEPLAAGLVLRQCQQIVGPASAQLGSQCGYTRDVPCYIMIIPSGG